MPGAAASPRASTACFSEDGAAVWRNVVIGLACTRYVLPFGDRPFGVLRAAVVPLGRDREFGDGPQLVLVKDARVRLRVVEVDGRVVPVGTADDLERLVTESGVERFEGLLGDDVGVGLDLAGHHHLAEAESALDDHPVLRAVARVGR